MWGEGGARLAAAPPQGAARADGCELQLVAYTVRLVRVRARVRLSPNPSPSPSPNLNPNPSPNPSPTPSPNPSPSPSPSPSPNQVRLLERKALLASRLRSICAEAEAELLERADGAYGAPAGASDPNP